MTQIILLNKGPWISEFNASNQCIL